MVQLLNTSFKQPHFPEVAQGFARYRVAHYFETYPRVTKPLRNLTLLLVVTGAPYMTQLQHSTRPISINCTHASSIATKSICYAAKFNVFICIPAVSTFKFEFPKKLQQFIQLIWILKNDSILSFCVFFLCSKTPGV